MRTNINIAGYYYEEGDSFIRLSMSVNDLTSVIFRPQSD